VNTPEILPGNIAIRLFTPDDFQAVCKLEQGEKGSPYSASVFVRQASVLFGPMFYVGACGDNVVGFSIGALSHAFPEEGWILRLKVSEDYQRRSIGTALISALISAFVRANVRRVLLTVAPGNKPARALYHAMGFRETAYATGYFGEGEDRLVLSATLDRKNCG
jgi:ribosomal-protein-alanine N-acetyltransferase